MCAGFLLRSHTKCYSSRSYFTPCMNTIYIYDENVTKLLHIRSTSLSASSIVILLTAHLHSSSIRALKIMYNSSNVVQDYIYDTTLLPPPIHSHVRHDISHTPKQFSETHSHEARRASLYRGGNSYISHCSSLPSNHLNPRSIYHRWERGQRARA